eukprot:scaffold34210_cov49-Attheya_sp.AAC.5
MADSRSFASLRLPTCARHRTPDPTTPTTTPQSIASANWFHFITPWRPPNPTSPLAYSPDDLECTCS